MASDNVKLGGSSQKSYEWWQTGVIYQIYPRSFKDTSGNGIGDLTGVIDKLEYLRNILGVDALWLSPFYPSPMADFGYDVSNYTDVHPLFGDIHVFDRLVSEAHQLGLRIIIDLVPNHSSNQHPWFLESRSSRDSPKRSWYVWEDAKADGSEPNNWQSVFGGPAWEWDPATQQYFLHSFLKEQPDLNWRNPEVKDAMFDVVRFWLDRGVDGFRIDVAHFIMKDPLMRDNPENISEDKFIHKPTGEYDNQLHIYDKGHEDVHGAYQDLRNLLDSHNPERQSVAIGEIHIFELPEWIRYYGEHLDELHLPFNFSLLKVDWTANAVRRSVDELEAALPEGAWPNYVLGNHDESRIATRIGDEQARIAAMLLLTLRGTPTLYYGDEIGMVDVSVPVDLQQDPWGLRVPGLSRDPNRTPMQWTSGRNSGFSTTERNNLWLPVADNFLERNVQTCFKDNHSILNLYIQLLEIRHSYDVLQVGDYHPINNVPEDCFVYTRTTTGEQVFVIALNFSNEEKHLQLLQYNRGQQVLTTHLDFTGSIDLSNLVLRGNEGVIVIAEVKNEME